MVQRGWALGVGLLICTGAIAACGGGGAAHDAEAAGASGDAADSSGGAPDGATGVDAPATEDRPDDGPASADLRGDRLSRPDAVAFDGSVDGQQMACNTLDDTAPTIAPVLRGFAAPPALQGGTLADGRYELVAVDVFSEVRVRAAVPSYYRRTIEVRNGGAELQLVELARADFNETSWTVVRRAYALATAGSMLTTTPDACADTGASTASYRYQVVADGFLTYYANTAVLLTYLRVP